MHVIVVTAMSDAPEDWRKRIRELSYGPYTELASGWGAWSWTFHDGSTWVACLFEGSEPVADKMIGWAALTRQIDHKPVVGAWVEPDYRKQGLASMVLTTLLRSMLAGENIERGDEIFAALHYWAGYPKVVNACGLKCVQWV